MNYGEAITRAARLVWQHKHLWVLGVIVALFSGTGSYGSSFNTSRGSGDFGEGDLPEPLRNLAGDPGAVLAGLIIAVVIVGLLILIWVIAGIILRPVARGSIAFSTNRLENALPANFRTAWSGGWQRKGRLIGISLLVELLPGFILALVIAGLIVALIVPIAAASGATGADPSGAIVAALGGGFIFVCCLVLIAIPVGIILSILAELSSVSAVLEERGVRASIGRAWRLMRAQPGPIALIWIVTVVVGGIVGMIVAIPAIIVGFSLFLAIMAGNTPALLWVLLILLLIVFAIVGLAVSGALAAFTTTLWTLTFRALTGDERGPLAPDTA